MMKTVPAVISVLCIAVFSLAVAPSVRAQQCPTQGAVALAFAQIFGYEVDEVEEAVEALQDVGLVTELWDPTDACVEAEFVKRVNQALRRAVAAGLLNHNEVSGAWELVFESIGHPEMLDEFTGLPGVFPATETPAKGWYPLEGTIEDDEGQPFSGPVRRTSRRTTEASPFVP